MLAAAPVPPLSSHQLLLFILQLAALLLLALCLGRLANRLGMPAVVGELLAGVLLGPSVLGHLLPAASDWLLPRRADQVHLLDAVGQLSVLLLVGITGVQVDLRVLRRQRATVLKISLFGLVVPLLLGAAAGWALAGTLVPAGTGTVAFVLFLGVAMCVSAIPVIAKTLGDMGLLHRNVGQLTLAAGVVDDAVGWFLLSVVSALAAAGLHAGRIGLSLLALAGFVAAVAVAGRPLVRLAMRAAARSPEPGVTVATAIVVILLGGAVTHALGMEPVFGAFAAGILISSAAGGPARLAPLRTVVQWVLAPLFLAGAGLRMDLTALARPDILGAALLILFVAVAGKFAGAYIGARAGGLTAWEGLALGAGMNARGAVQMVVATVGLRLGVLDVASYTIVLFVAIATSLMAPPMLRTAMSRIEQTTEERLREAEHEAAWSPSAADAVDR